MHLAIAGQVQIATCGPIAALDSGKGLLDLVRATLCVCQASLRLGDPAQDAHPNNPFRIQTGFQHALMLAQDPLPEVGSLLNS